MHSAFLGLILVFFPTGMDDFGIQALKRELFWLQN
jgi:hypothetical protein